MAIGTIWYTHDVAKKNPCHTWLLFHLMQLNVAWRWPNIIVDNENRIVNNNVHQSYMACPKSWAIVPWWPFYSSVHYRSRTSIWKMCGETILWVYGHVRVILLRKRKKYQRWPRFGQGLQTLCWLRFVMWSIWDQHMNEHVCLDVKYSSWNAVSLHFFHFIVAIVGV